MSEHHENAPTFEQIQEFNAAVLKALPRLTRFQQQRWIGDSGVLRLALADALVEHSVSASNQLSFWLAFYRQRFPREFDAAGGEKAFRSIQIPEERTDFIWLVVVLQGITTKQVYDLCEALFDTDIAKGVGGIDFNLLADERDNKKSYAIWVRARQEADNELAGQKPMGIKAKKLKTMTLVERMLLELRYFTEFGDHLDKDFKTICTGSPLPNGVATAGQDNNKFFVGWEHPDYTSSKHAAREVVA